MIDISRPAEAIGRKVTYQPYPGASIEEGVITEVRISSTHEPIVFARYGSDVGAKATRPSDLNFIAVAR